MKERKRTIRHTEEHAPENDTIDIRQLLIVIRKRRWTIGLILLLCMLLAAVYSFKRPEVYRASARMLLEKDTPNVVSFKEVVDSDLEDHDAYQSQAQILKSRPLAQQTIQKLDLSVESLQATDLPFRRWFGEAASHLKTWMGKPEELPASDDAQTTIREERAIRLFLRSITVAPLKGSRIVTVSADAAEAELAASMANTLMDLYIRQALDMKLSASRDAVNWLMIEVEDAKHKVTESETALQQYKEQHEILSLQDRQNLVTQKLSELNSSLHQAKVRRMEIEAQHRRVQQTPEQERAMLPQVLNDSLVRQLKLQEIMLENERLELLKKFREKHPSVTAIHSQITGIQHQIRQQIRQIVTSVQTEYEMALAHEQDLLHALDQQKAEAQTLNQKSIEYHVLEREVQSNRQMHNALLQRLKEASLTERLESSHIRIVERAAVPIGPIAPSKARNLLLAAALGVFLGMGLAFFLENLDRKLQTPHDVKTAFNVPMLGAIPKVTAKQLAPYAENGTMETIVATMMIFDGRSTIAESYRSLRTNVSFAGMGRDAVFLVTSSVPGEGKSSVVSNLGIALAQSGRKTLIIDCDFRKPMIHHIFGLEHAKSGFSDVLIHSGDDILKQTIRHTDLQALDILPCGSIPPNPSELLSLEKTAWIVESLAKEYHTILIDSPPVNAVTDPIVLSQITHGVIFVIKAGTTSDVAAHALEQLELADAKICGLVLNDIDFQKDNYYYYGYKDSTYYQHH